MRRKDREITDMQQILSIVDRCKILRLGLFDRDYPYVVPLHYGYEFFENRLVFYMHSATEGHKLALIADNPHVCVELDGDAELISGGEIPCMYGSSFASVIGRDFAFTGEMAATVAVIRVTLNKFTAKSKPKA